MHYNFDKPVDRRGSGSYKWDALRREFDCDDAIPMWVADMDFETPPFIIEALKQRLEHPVLGYSLDGDDFWPLIINWWKEHHGWAPEPGTLRYVPGVVKGIALAVQRLTQPGDGIIVQQPVYHPFASIVEGMERRLVVNPLLQREDGLYDMDFEHLRSIADGCKMLILCNPHNPGGVAWSRETLTELAQICSEKGLIVISDEIHSDLVLWGRRHIPFASVSDEARRISVTFSAPSKTFNIAGIVSSFCFVSDEAMRERLFDWMDSAELGETHLFAVVATKAAYRYGAEWHKQLVEYIERNIDFVVDYCNHQLPKQSDGTPLIKAIRPEASYLVWLDCRAMGLTQKELCDFFLRDAKLALNDGSAFGQGGEGYMRINLGCQRSTVEKAMQHLKMACSKL